MLLHAPKKKTPGSPGAVGKYTRSVMSGTSDLYREVGVARKPLSA